MLSFSTKHLQLAAEPTAATMHTTPRGMAEGTKERRNMQYRKAKTAPPPLCSLCDAAIGECTVQENALTQHQ
jgi:hypothetical protein